MSNPWRRNSKSRLLIPFLFQLLNLFDQHVILVLKPSCLLLKMLKHLNTKLIFCRYILCFPLRSFSPWFSSLWVTPPCALLFHALSGFLSATSSWILTMFYLIPLHTLYGFSLSHHSTLLLRLRSHKRLKRRQLLPRLPTPHTLQKGLPGGTEDDRRLPLGVMGATWAHNPRKLQVHLLLLNSKCVQVSAAYAQILHLIIACTWPLVICICIYIYIYSSKSVPIPIPIFFIDICSTYIHIHI